METSQQNLSIAFRPMTLADVARVREIDVLSFSMPWSERSYQFEVRDNGNAVNWVAQVIPNVDQNGEGSIVSPRNGATPVIAGMIVTWVIVDEAHIATIATHPDYRRHGIARRLLARALLSGYERGARMAYLEVRRSNHAAQKLYEQFGFFLVGERPRYYQDNNEDALLMTLENIQPDLLLKLVQ